MQWTPEQITAIAAAVCAAIAAVFSKNVVDSIIRFADWWATWKEKREAKRIAAEEKKLAQRALDEELNERGYKYVIRRQDRRITELEQISADCREEHSKCREECSIFRSEITRLQKRVEHLEGNSSESDA